MTEVQQKERVTRLSYSSVSSYAECGERWRLERLYHVGGATWWATVMGSTGHYITELWDKGEVTSEQAIEMVGSTLERYAAEAEEKGPIRASGRQCKSLTLSGGPNKKDKEWVLHYLPTFIQQYIDWRMESNWVLMAMPGGELAIEVPIDVEMGGEPQKGFIDRIFMAEAPARLSAGLLFGVSKPEPIVVDLKFGNAPSSAMQLGTYAVGLKRQYGIEAKHGCYYMAKDGKPSEMSDLTVYTEEFMDGLYEQAWRGIRAGVFLPNVSNFCGSCGVRDWCRATKGSKVHEVPVLEADLGMPEYLNV